MEDTQDLMVRYITAEGLQLLEKNGIMTPDAVQALIIMDKRNKLLEQHKYSIKLGPDGRWHTYF